jgi:hypothetical protein
VSGDDELDRRKVSLGPLADALLPGDVSVRVHVVDKDDSRVRQVIRSAKSRGTIVVNLLATAGPQAGLGTQGTSRILEARWSMRI